MSEPTPTADPFSPLEFELSMALKHNTTLSRLEKVLISKLFEKIQNEDKAAFSKINTTR